MRERILLLPFIVSCVMAPRLLTADCLNGIRPATEAERAFRASTLNVLRKAIPTPPAGWRVIHGSVATSNSVCVDAASVPMSVRYEARYLSGEAQAAVSQRAKQHRHRAEELRALPPDQQAQVDDLEKRSRDLGRSARKEAAAGNKAEGARLGEQAAELDRQAAAIEKAHRASTNAALRTMIQESSAQERRLRPEVRVDYWVNRESVELAGEVSRLTIPGTAQALRSGENTVLCFGVWKSAGQPSRKAVLQAAFKAGHPAAAAQTITVRLTGNPKLVDEVLAALDGRALAALITE